ncbi:MAG TPA: hypothetical protein VNZ49_08685 [Bacteroidia bacterium]|jgi:hypothetical protein|nr:hypothetical protein [Bacteroidia bacterium]
MEIYHIHLYELLKAKLDEKEAHSLTKQIKSGLDTSFIEAKIIPASKEDIAMLKTDIINTKIEILKYIILFFLILFLALLGLFVILI